MAWIGGALSAGGSIFSGLFGGDAATSAAKTQAKAANRAIDFEESIWQQIQQQLAPYLQSGGQANNWLSQLLFGNGTSSMLMESPADLAGLPRAPTPYTPLTAETFRQSPGYQWQLGQTVGAVQNSGAAKGLTGNTLRDIQGYASGLADQDWQSANTQHIQDYQLGNQDYWTRYNAAAQQQGNIFSRLFGVSGTGQNAATSQGAAGLQVGGNVGNALIGQGNNLASGIMGSANQLSSGFQNALYRLLYGGGGSSANNSLAWLFGGGGGSWDNAATAGTGGY
jgi:hypothetical protein